MLVPVILSAAKDLTERLDTGRVAGVRSFAEARRLLRATQDDISLDRAHPCALMCGM